MLSIERRVAALEDATQDKGLKLVVLEDGQTEEDALRVAGLPPGTRNVIWCTALDALL